MTALPVTGSPPLTGHVPRWANWAALTVPWLVVPSGLWRIAMSLGVPMGFTGEMARLYHAPGLITPYLWALTAAAEVAALLTLGLVRPWGEVVPAWVPLIGGRRIPTLAAVSVAAFGVVALTAIAVPTVANWNGPENNGHPEAPQGLAGLVMTVCYAPQLAWPPLLAVVTVAYLRRRGRGSARLRGGPGHPGDRSGDPGRGPARRAGRPGPSRRARRVARADGRWPRRVGVRAAGSGGSSRLADPRGYTVELAIADLERVRLLIGAPAWSCWATRTAGSCPPPTPPRTRTGWNGSSCPPLTP